MWVAAAQVKIAQTLGRSEATVRRAGLSLTCGTGDGQGSFCAIAGPDYEPELRWLLGQLQSGDTFVDVGANIGIYSLQAARKLKGAGSVFAVEPSPDALRVLQQNITYNGFAEVVTAVHAAASRKEGQLYLGGDPTKWNSLQLHEHPPGIPIEVTTVDTILRGPKRRSNFHFLKIDAEGVETDVLEGAWESIQESWPKIIFENSINRLDALPTDWLRKRGYKICAIDHRGRVTEASPSSYCRHTNLVAVHPHSRSAS